MKRWTAFGVASALFFGYLLVLPVPHTTALRNLFLYGSLLAVAASLVRREVRWPRADKAAWLLVGYALVAVLALFASGLDVQRSLREVRGELLVQLYVLGFSLLYLRNRPSPWPLLWALAGGFVLLVLYAAFALARARLGGAALFSEAFHLRQLVPGYGLNAQFYLPVLVGLLAAAPLPTARRALAVLAALGAYALALWYDTTSAVVFISLHALYVVLRQLRVRARIGGARLALALLLGVLAAGLALRGDPTAKLTSQAQLVAEGRYYELLSHRGGIWAIALPCALDAPWHGYGYGQKKIALVCRDEAAYLAPARARGNFMADFYRDMDYGKLSLHNQYLENWLIAGWLGALLWLAFFLGALRSAWRARSEDGLQQLVVLPALLIFLAGCLFNGLWEGAAYSKALMVVLALALARREAQA